MEREYEFPYLKYSQELLTKKILNHNLKKKKNHLSPNAKVTHNAGCLDEVGIVVQQK